MYLRKTKNGKNSFDGLYANNLLRKELKEMKLVRNGGKRKKVFKKIKGKKTFTRKNYV